jgi:hypothetical protein
LNNKVNKTEVMIYWKPPIEDWVKFYTDGAYKEGRVVGCGGVIRDSSGEKADLLRIWVFLVPMWLNYEEF